MVRWSSASEKALALVSHAQTAGRDIGAAPSAAEGHSRTFTVMRCLSVRSWQNLELASRSDKNSNPLSGRRWCEPRAGVAFHEPPDGCFGNLRLARTGIQECNARFGSWNALP